MSDERSEVGVSARLDPATIDRLDAIGSELTKRAAGVHVSRAAVVKQAILRGLEALERETKK